MQKYNERMNRTKDIPWLTWSLPFGYQFRLQALQPDRTDQGKKRVSVLFSTTFVNSDSKKDDEEPEIVCRYQKVFESIEPYERLVHRFVRTPGRHVRPL
jgi:hypothetical protein